MMSLRSYIFFIPVVVIFMGCSGDVANEKQMDNSHLKEHLVNANKIFVENEAEQIDAWLVRHRIVMETSGTGLRYRIFQKGIKKIQPFPGDSIIIQYKVDLLDGSTCYTTENNPVQFMVGKAEMPRGMDEAIQMMQEGDSCVIILPAHLAYGFTGDGDKIPGNTTTVYYISLKQIINK